MLKDGGRAMRLEFCNTLAYTAANVTTSLCLVLASSCKRNEQYLLLNTCQSQCRHMLPFIWVTWAAWKVSSTKILLSST